MKTPIGDEEDLRNQLARDGDGTMAHQLVFDLCSHASRWRAQASVAAARCEQERAILVASAFADAAHIVETLAPRLRSH
jgi:hypothetical protein